MRLLRGRVSSGYGDWSYWLRVLSEFYQQKTGVVLYPGTLNLRLDEPWYTPPNPLRLEAHEYGGRVSVNIVPCDIRGTLGFILRTDQNELEELGHPRTIVEVASQHRLRDRYQLSDGDLFEVTVL